MIDVKTLADFEGDDPDAGAIEKWAMDHGGLPAESARPFSEWLDSVWNDYGDGSGTQTIGSILKGALEFWKGDA